MLPICSCSLLVRDDDDVDFWLLVAVVFVVVVVVVVALVSVTVVPAVAVVVVFFAGWWYSGHCCRGAIRPGRGGCPKFWREELKVDALARTTTPATHSQPSEDATRSGGIEQWTNYELGDDDNACCWTLGVSTRLIAEQILIPLSYFLNPAH